MAGVCSWGQDVSLHLDYVSHVFIRVTITTLHSVYYYSHFIDKETEVTEAAFKDSFCLCENVSYSFNFLGTCD